MDDEVNTSEAFRYIWYIFRVNGLHPFSKFKKLYSIYSYTFLLLISISAPITLFANLFAVPNINLQMILASFPINLTFLTTSSKQFALLFLKQNLIKAESILSNLDRRAQTNDDRIHLKRTVKYCHQMYFLYTGVFYMALSSFLVTPLFSVGYRLPFDAWFPFDFKDKYYYLAYLYQIISSTALATQNLANDIYPPSYILILTGHMHVLNTRISNIGYDVKVNYKDNTQELVACIKDHNNILEYFHQISTVISATIFIQFLVTAVIICLTTVNILVFEATKAEAVTAIAYLMVILCEVFPCCYLSNRMVDEFDKLTTYIFKCNWMDQTMEFRKNLLIFMQRSQRVEKLSAARLFPISLDTLVGILKFSFSMFSILSQLKS